MGKTIQDLVDNATSEKTNGKVHIAYENIADLRWISQGDDDSLRGIKHWRLVIQLGFDAFTLEYLQDSVFTFQGLVMVGPFNPDATNNPRLYHVGDLRELDSKELFGWIQKEFSSKEQYNVITNNCHDFVHSFLAKFEESGHLSRTGHLEASVNRQQLGTGKDQKIRSDCYTNVHLKAIGELIVVASTSFKPATEPNPKS